MRKKRHAKRTIVVDGVTYTWKYGDWVEITWDDLERGERKGYGFPLTPKRVAELIKEVAA